MMAKGQFLWFKEAFFILFLKKDYIKFGSIKNNCYLCTRNSETAVKQSR